VGALSHIYHDEGLTQMPAKDFLEKFNFDPATFQYDAFKASLLSEIDTDNDLATTKITQLTEDTTRLTASERDLKVKLFDATVMKTGTPVDPANDSPTGTVGATPGSAPAVPESEIFG
jgi:hypothetical protein